MTHWGAVGLRKVVVPEIVFGVGSRRLVGRYARNLSARRAFVVSDPGVVGAGWADDVLESLKAEGIVTFLFSDVTPNPTIDEASRGAGAYRQSGCDLLVAVGGGSPIDCAKGIGVLLANGGALGVYAGVDRMASRGPPLLCVPTTAGSGADVSQFAILNDPARRVKLALVSKLLVPDVSLVDPETTRSLPVRYTVGSALDALAHAFEAGPSNAAWPLTDLFAEDAAARLVTSRPAVLRHPDVLEARSEVAYASLLAGLAFSHASLGLVHAISHAVGGLNRETVHGLLNAAVLPHAILFNYAAAAPAYDRLARAIGIDLSQAAEPERPRLLKEALQRLIRDVGAPLTLAECGAEPAEDELVAERAFVDASLVTNPRRPSLEEIRGVYRDAL